MLSADPSATEQMRDARFRSQTCSCAMFGAGPAATAGCEMCLPPSEWQTDPACSYVSALPFALNSCPQRFSTTNNCFEQFIHQPYTCTQCSVTFTASSAGTLACSYHPYAFVNRETSLMASDATLSPTDCAYCQQLHLATPLRDPNTLAALRMRQFTPLTYNERRGRLGRIPLTPTAPSRSLGCAAIDHSVSIAELYRCPFVALPTVFFDRLVLASVDERRTAAAGNVLLIDNPAQLARTLCIDLPGAVEPFRESIVAVYEEMAAKFEMPSLEDEARLARIALRETASGSMKELQHPDAVRKELLYERSTEKALFSPFLVIARVSQTSYDSGGMRLE